MKKAISLTVFSSLLISALAFTGCGNATPADGLTGTDNISADAGTVDHIPLNEVIAQVNIILDNIETWQLIKPDDDEFRADIFGYATADLDHNGRLEFIISTVLGNGSLSENTFYEINETKDGIEKLVVKKSGLGDDDVVPDFLGNDDFSVYFDPKYNEFDYMVPDLFDQGLGFGGMYKTAVMKKDNFVSYRVFASDTNGFENEDSEDFEEEYKVLGNENATEEDFENAEKAIFKNYTEQPVYFGFITDTILFGSQNGWHFEQMSRPKREQRLVDSYLVFSDSLDLELFNEKYNSPEE